MNNVILCLTETQLDSWEARFPYLNAKIENRRLELYQMDLLWLIAKRYYNELPQPSEVANGAKKRDNRSAKQITSDILKKLGAGR